LPPDPSNLSIDLQVLIGGCATPENLHRVFAKVDGLIVGSYFKRDGKGNNLVDEERVKAFAAALASRPGGRQGKKGWKEAC
jgi:predicted TIM-barrel enzyme